MRNLFRVIAKSVGFHAKHSRRITVRLKKSVALLCAAAILLTVILAGFRINDINASAEESDSNNAKMLYLYNSLVQTKSTTNPAAYFVIPVEAGKKYVLSYYLKTKGYGAKVYPLTSSGNKDENAVKYASTTVDGFHYTHNVEVNSGTTFRAVFETKPYANGNYPYTEMYIADFEMFEADDTYSPLNDTNLLEKIGNFSEWTSTKYKANKAYSLNKGTNAYSSDSGKLLEIPDGFFGGDEASLVSAAYVNGSDKDKFLRQFSILEPGKKYRISYDLKLLDGDVNVTLKAFNASGTASDIAFSPQEEGDNHFSGTITMPSSLRKHKNMRLDVTAASNNSEFYFGNYEIYELDTNDAPTGTGLALDPYFSNVITTITNDKACWITNFADKISYESQTANTFLNTEPYMIYISGTNGVFSQFVNAKPDTKYAMTFDCRYTSESYATPYIKGFSSGTRSEIAITDITPLDYKDKYKKTYYFTTPADLDSSYNLRIGFEFTADVSGYFANAELFELDQNGVNSGENLFSNASFSSKAKVIAYSGELNDNWTKENSFAKFEFSKIPTNFFDILPKNMLILKGGSSTTGDGRWGWIEQCAVLKPGTKYMLSADIRYANTREGDTMGPDLKWQNTSGSDLKFSDLSIVEDESSYRRHYTFTMDPNARTTAGVTNFRLRIWMSTAFCTGYFSDFELYELDDSNNKTGQNILLNGSFETGNISDWIPEGKTEKEVKRNFYAFEIIKRNDDTFTKASSLKSTYVLEYKNKQSWTYVAQYVTLKPDTKYRFKGQAIHIINDPEYPSGFSFQSFNDISSSYISVSKTVDGNNITTGTFTTPSDLRKEGDNVKIFLNMPGTSNVGFWGATELYELDGNGDPIGNNIILNPDFSCGLAAWELSGGYDIKVGKINDDSLFTTGLIRNYMIQSTGSGTNEMFYQTLKLQPGETYYFSGNIVNMNAEGVEPRVMYKAKGSDKLKSIDLVTNYDLDRFGFDTSFTVPDDAQIVDSSAIVTVGLFNKKGGKGYLSNLMLTKAGEYINIFTNPNLSNSGSGWTFNKNYKVIPYDSSVFILYSDDKAFDDGNWSGTEENEFAYVMGAIDGKIVDANYDGIKGLTVKLNKGGYSTVTDAFGSFSFSRIEPGEYKLYVIFNRVEEFCTDVIVDPGRSVSISEIMISEIEISEEDEIEETETVDPSICGVVVGKYIGKNGKPMVNQDIYLSKNLRATTDENGEFRFDMVPEGKYKVYILVSETKGKVLKQISVVAGKGLKIVIDESEQIEEEQQINLPLIIGLSAAGFVLIAGGLTAFLIIIKKKRSSKAANV